MHHVAIQPPAWLRGSAVYQVNLRTFSPEGTLPALQAELPALQALGFRVIYLCPVFAEDISQDRRFWSERQKASGTDNPKNPYRIKDYFQIDEEYGSMAALQALVKEAHRLGMKVLLDLVYLHISPNAAILQSHPEYALQNEDGTHRLSEWHFALWDYRCRGLRDYLLGNMLYYLQELDVDGFRCNAADGVPHDFWAEARACMLTAKPDAVLLNEGVRYERMADAFDASYNYDWHEQLYRVFTGDCSLKTLIKTEKATMATAPAGSYLLRDFDNHDTVTDWEKRGELLVHHDGMELVQVLNYTFPGIPMVYAGNELADTMVHSLFANRDYPGRFSATDRHALRNTAPALRRQEVMKTLNRFLREKPAMHNTAVEWPDGNWPAQVLCFRRPDEEHPLLFIGNFCQQAVTVESALAGYKTLLANNAAIRDNQVILQNYGYILLER